MERNIISSYEKYHERQKLGGFYSSSNGLNIATIARKMMKECVVECMHVNQGLSQDERRCFI
jgi:hypothetical protein